jgi:hypothetical protein
MFTIAAGTTKATINVPVIADSTGTTESFTITLSGLSSNALFSNLQTTEAATGTILPQASGTNTSTITLSASPTTAASGQQVVLTATVSGSGGTPTGSVTFMLGTTVLGHRILERQRAGGSRYHLASGRS